MARVALLVLAVSALLVGALGSLELPSYSLLMAEAVRASDERKALKPEDWSWYRRHERALRDCRGQQYVAQCCQDARVDITCIDANLKGRK